MLIETTEATDGQEGMDVEGNVIAAKDGRPVKIRAGKNCYQSDEDVGVGTGDIIFNGGEVKVHGNVLSGMKVKCQKLSVDGLIEDAKIVVSGDLDVDKGIQGHQHAVINCNGNLHCKYISNAKVYAHGSITADAILNSDVSSNDTITADGKKKDVSSEAKFLQKATSMQKPLALNLVCQHVSHWGGKSVLYLNLSKRLSLVLMN